MTLNLRNLEWLRSLKLDGHPDFGARLHEMFTDTRNGINTLEQQGNFSLQGTPAAPPMPNGLTVIPHPQGVQFAISHNADFYQGVQYEIDATAGSVTHTYDVGTSRNGILPVGNLNASYQVRARYPNGASTTPVRCPKAVIGGNGNASLLPSQAAGTTKANQAPGFGGPFRGSNPPVRGQR